MAAKDKSPKTPAGKNGDAPGEKQEEDDKDQTGHDRIWASPIGTGDPIPFDPTKFAPPLSKEELEKLLKGDKR
jgi:hypothetical protein